uniref:TYRO protein tyrosine kinase-binding protein n=1 Tax=Lepisosteus oculatus TaxID=7918 RepID=W5MH75_LEPOC
RQHRDRCVERSGLQLTPLILTATKETITVKDEEDKIVFTCEGGKWIDASDNERLELEYQNKKTGYYTCDSENNATLYVKFRTCDNCIQADASTIAGIVVGDLVATLLIGVAVYCVSSQPKGRSYSNNKASDRVNLLQGDGLYQPLTGNQDSNYSQLERRPR